MVEEFSQEASSLEQPRYSPEFQDLIAGNRLNDLLRESHFYPESPNDRERALKEWEDERRFITQVINKDGSILDYGCANGFLLRSLQEWSPHKLEPYGVDIDPKGIERAKKLFPSIIKHFITPREAQERQDFPRSFDFIFWNVWDNWDFTFLQQTALLDQLLKQINPQGRLILGFYRNNKYENVAEIKRLIISGYKFDGVIKNPQGRGTIVWIDKPAD